jgi:hypothetical protein
MKMHEHEDEMEYGHRGHGYWGPLRIAGMVAGGLVLAVVFGFAFGLFVKMLWNWLMPELFGFKVITFWQAFGLVILGKLIFGCGGHMGRQRNHGKWHSEKWRKRVHMRDDWAPNGDYSNWRYYEDYWKTEGKAAYESYLEKMKSQGNGGNKA